MPDHKRITLSEELDGLKRKGNTIFNGNNKCSVNLKMALWDFDNNFKTTAHTCTS